MNNDENASQDKPPEQVQPLFCQSVRGEPLTYQFEELSNGQVEVLITLEGQPYRLRRTRNHRLILTK